MSIAFRTFGAVSQLLLIFGRPSSTRFFKMSVQATRNYELSPSVRLATQDDLPAIQQLIVESFRAMGEVYPHEELIQMFDEAVAKIQTDGDISDKDFASVYNISKEKKMWVIESDDKVCGCVGLKKLSHDDAELVRMAISPSARGQGQGTKLISNLFAYASELGVQRIVLGTANPRSANFYEKHGFVSYSSSKFNPRGLPYEMQVFSMVKFLSEKVIRTVGIVGGTHGNERVGLELVRQWTHNSNPVSKESFRTILAVGNPEAASYNRRFVDADLNRQFTESEATATATLQPSNEPYEATRAKELRNNLATSGGSIETPVSPETAVDFIIDLHTSTSNTGNMAMIAGGKEDVVALRVAHHLQSHGFPDLKITVSNGTKAAAYSLDSLAPSGLAFEVGPLVHGTITSAALETTRSLVLATLDYIDQRNQLLLSGSVPSEAVDGAAVALQRGEGGESVKVDGKELVLDCAAPSIIRKTEFPKAEVYSFVSRVKYPTTSPAAVVGESASSSSPSFPSEKTILEAAAQSPLLRGLDRVGPQLYVVHPSLEFNDWTPLKEGDPVFVSTDGLKTVVPFSSILLETPPSSSTARPPSSESSDEYYPVFVNEAAYQGNGVAFCVFKKQSVVVI